MNVEAVATGSASVNTDTRRQRWRMIARVALAGPLALISSTCVWLAMPLWYPPGAADIDNLVVPILIFPLIWSALFFHACLDSRLLRVAAVSLLSAGLSAAMIALKFAGLAF